MKALRKVLDIIVTILIICVLVVSVLIATVSLTAKANDGIPNVLGKATITVLSDSMKGDASDCFVAGDLILCDVLSDEEKAEATYQVGDIVTFQQDVDNDGNADLVTHRIYKVNKDGTYQTKGDNNFEIDQAEGNLNRFPNISNFDIVATYHGFKIPGAGNFFAYIRTQTGFFLVVLLPMIIFFLYEAVRVIINIIAYNKEKAVANAEAIINSSVLTEEQKQRAIAEYLASQAGATPPEAETTAENSDEA